MSGAVERAVAAALEAHPVGETVESLTRGAQALLERAAADAGVEPQALLDRMRSEQALARDVDSAAASIAREARR